MWRLRAFGRWLFVDARSAWAAFGVPALATVIGIALPAPSELGIRAAGYALTLAGVLLVVRGVIETQSLFKRPSYRSRVTLWLKRLPPIFQRRQVIVAAGAAALGMATASARASVWSNPRDDSITERVRVLEQNLGRVKEHVVAVENRLDQEVRAFQHSLATETSARDAKIAQLAQTIETYTTGSLDGELVGVAWVVVGQAFGSFPAEIARLLA